jgi:hypothetical protein
MRQVDPAVHEQTDSPTSKLVMRSLLPPCKLRVVPLWLEENGRNHERAQVLACGTTRMSENKIAASKPKHILTVLLAGALGDARASLTALADDKIGPPPTRLNA